MHSQYARLLGLTVAFSLLLGSTALADGLNSDGDSANAGNNTVVSGDDCGTEQVVQGQLQLTKNEGNNKYDNSTPLTVSVTVTDSDDASYSKVGSALVTGPFNTPSNWRSSANGTQHTIGNFSTVVDADVDNGVYSVEYTVSGAGEYKASGVFVRGTVELSDSFTVTVDCAAGPEYTIDGFYQPVENRTRNTMKGGAVVPIKFNILDGDENKIDDPDAIQLFVSQRTCTSTSSDVNLLDSTETQSSGKTELRWDAIGGPDGDGQWVFNWKSPKVGADTCYRILLEVAGDSEYADFLLRK